MTTKFTNKIPSKLRRLITLWKSDKRRFRHICEQAFGDLLGRWSRSRDVIYHPSFSNPQALTSHLYRASWYLPKSDTGARKVFMPAVAGVEPGGPPAGMAPIYQSGHIEIRPVGLWRIFQLMRCRVVLAWQRPPRWLRGLCRLTGARIINVTTDNAKAKEYGRYPQVAWRHIVSAKCRKRAIRKSHARLASIHSQLAADAPIQCVVFGTGPSLDCSTIFDFSDKLCIACNSIVQSKVLMDHIKPKFVTAGDAVSHFGISEYAHQFRLDLREALTAHGATLLTTAPFGWLFTQHYPELSDSVIFAPQVESPTPSHDLLSRFELPTLDSTLNIHMLPLAATFSDDIYILGCDGQDPDPNRNEDFWPHSALAQYHDLVETGHVCHPTFAPARAKTTFNRFQDSIRTSISTAERASKSITSLTPSFHKPLDNRLFVPHKDNSSGVLRWVTPTEFQGMPAEGPWVRRGVRQVISRQCPQTIHLGNTASQPTLWLLDVDASESCQLHLKISNGRSEVASHKLTVSRQRKLYQIPLPIQSSVTVTTCAETDRSIEVRVYQSALVTANSPTNEKGLPIPSPSWRLPLHIDWKPQPAAGEIIQKGNANWLCHIKPEACIKGCIYRPAKMGDQWTIDFTLTSNTKTCVTVSAIDPNEPESHLASTVLTINDKPTISRLDWLFLKPSQYCTLCISNHSSKSATIELRSGLHGFWRLTQRS